MSFDRKNGSVYFAVMAQILVSANSDKKFQEKYSFAESKTALKRLTDLINLYRSKGIPSPELDGIMVNFLSMGTKFSLVGTEVFAFETFPRPDFLFRWNEILLD